MTDKAEDLLNRPGQNVILSAGLGYDSKKGVVVYGPQGCGKTQYSEKLKRLFNKPLIIDGWCEGDILPDDAIALTNIPVSGLANSFSFWDVRTYF